MVDLKPLTASMIFTNALGYLLDLGGFIEFSFMSSTVFLIGSSIMMLAIGLANTPALKGGAVLGFALFFFAYLTSVIVPDPILSLWIYGFMTLPTLITLGGVFLELGKG